MNGCAPSVTIPMAIGGGVIRPWLLTLDGSLHFPDLRAITVGAGPTYREHIEAYRRDLPDYCVMLNTYSATEVRSCATFVVDKSSKIESRLLPAGFATLHGAVEIWDEGGIPVPLGETGEIVIISPYIAAGYWKSPQLTASRFGTDAEGRRFYRTGDLGRLDEQGCLWVLGRKDRQVKIRGNRVETAEVELALMDLPNVQEAAVIDMGDTDDSRVLLGFVASNKELAGGELRKQLTTRLPEHMVPSTIVVLGELPRNRIGKVARPLLREMAIAFAKTTPTQRVRQELFRTETEGRVAAMVNELLGGSDIGPFDNFFDSGGHSLLAARLMLTIHRTFGVDLPPRDFFTEPTVAALAASIERALGQQSQPSPVVEQAVTLGIEAVQVLRGVPTQLPVFLCIGWNGSLTVLMRYQELIRRLGDQWPLYGLVASGCSDPNRLFATMDGLVDAALLALRQVQPHGPYLLVGECLGGKLAFELAHRLERAGEEIGLLMLLDPPMLPRITEQNASRQRWAKIERQGEIWRERIEHHWQQVADLGWRAGARYIVERLTALLPRALVPQSSFRPHYLARKRYVNLLTHHVPSETLAQGATAIFTSHFQHHQQLWAARVQGLDVTIIEGTHQEYLAAAGDEVAALLRKHLEGALSTQKGMPATSTSKLANSEVTALAQVEQR